METMPEFCTNCGAQLSGAFCGRCGHRAQSASAPAQPTASTPQPVAAPTAQPAAPQPASQPPSPQPSVAQQAAQPTIQAPVALPPKSSGGGKALLIVGGIVLVLALGAFGAVFYGVQWVKHKVSSITGGAIGGSSSSEVSQGNMCKLLSTGELQQMIGVTVERSAEIMDNGDPGCAYYTNPAAFSQLQKRALEQAKRDSERASQYPDVKNSKSDNPLELLKHTQEMEGIVKGFGLSAPDPSGKVFSLDR